MLCFVFELVRVCVCSGLGIVTFCLLLFVHFRGKAVSREQSVCSDKSASSELPASHRQPPLGLSFARTMTSMHTHRSSPCCDSSGRSEEHTSELQSLMRISYAVFCFKNKNATRTQQSNN